MRIPLNKSLMVGVACFALGAGAMAYLNQRAQADTPRTETFQMLELFGDVLATVQTQYVTKVDDKDLIEAAINGMLTSLDPHSGYLNLGDFQEMQDQTRGEYGGLGLEVTAEDGLVKVIAPMDDTPASRAGVMAGDFIAAINGKSVMGLSLNDAVKQMRGAVGEDITLTLAREGKDPFDVTLKREVIVVKAVKGRMEGDYGVVRVSGFNEKVGEETTNAIRALQTQNPRMKGLVLDLRNNPGGLLDQAIEVSDVFLSGGEVVSQRGRDPRSIERYNARPGDMLEGLPLVVLINGGSASASEIVAGAIQDRQRGVVVGLTSFGKGSVQTVIPLRGGRDGALKLTTARYYTPAGRSIQQTGIEPDLEVARSSDEADLYAKSAELFSEAGLQNALSASEGLTRRKAHEIAEIPPEGYDVEKDDYQLARALDVLKAGGGLRAVAQVARPRPAKVADATGEASSTTRPAAGVTTKPTVEAQEPAKSIPPEVVAPPQP